MYQCFLILQCDIVILGLVQGVVVCDLYVDQVMIAAIILREACQYALTAVGILTTVTVELILSSGMFVAAPIVLAPQIHIHASMGRHDLSQVVLQLMILMCVDITLVTEVGIIILTELCRLTATGDTVLDL